MYGIVSGGFKENVVMTVEDKRLTMWMFSCAPSKFCSSRTHTLNDEEVTSSSHVLEASCFIPSRSCSAVRSTVGGERNFP